MGATRLLGLQYGNAAWRRWYEGAVKRELNRIGGGAAVPVPIRFKHRYQLLSDKSLNRYDCYALDDYMPTRGYGTRPGSTGSFTVSNRGVRYWAASNRQDSRCRFESFCKLLCGVMGMENGFEAIEIKSPGPP